MKPWNETAIKQRTRILIAGALRMSDLKEVSRLGASSNGQACKMTGEREVEISIQTEDRDIDPVYVRRSMDSS